MPREPAGLGHRNEQNAWFRQKERDLESRRARSMTLRQRARAARIADQCGLLIFCQAAAATRASANHIDPVEHPAFELTLSEPGESAIDIDRSLDAVMQLENVKRHARDSEFAKQKKRLVAAARDAVRDAATSTASSR
ncbi:unnamed protein product [Prorocentrum cordatum]|uniref:Uncharacterized protein n=1 Tax=Prorocentrum cordatum TaxID=2364126 RepID=A0ABN9RUJ3_9DINO|nr:unnamed protein product [Polarella glacialis]